MVLSHTENVRFCEKFLSVQPLLTSLTWVDTFPECNKLPFHEEWFIFMVHIFRMVLLHTENIRTAKSFSLFSLRGLRLHGSILFANAISCLLMKNASYFWGQTIRYLLNHVDIAMLPENDKTLASQSVLWQLDL